MEEASESNPLMFRVGARAGTAPLSTFEKLSWFSSPRAFHLNLGSSADTGDDHISVREAKFSPKVWDTSTSFSYTYLF